MCSIDLETAAVWEEFPSVARKQHQCDMCFGRIEVGQPYIRHRSFFDGHWTAEKKCQLCAEICDAFSDEHGSHGCPHYMRELLDECVGGLEYHPETARWKLALLQMEQRYVAAKAAAHA